MNFVRVALDVPLGKLFEYRTGEITEGDIGRRVLVPFGKKIMVGVIMELARTSILPRARVREVICLLDDGALLSPDVLALFRFCSDYYHYPLGEVVLNALPPLLRRRQSVRSHLSKCIQLTAAGRAVDPDSLPKRATKQRELLTHLQSQDTAIDEAALRETTSSAATILKLFLASGWIEYVAPAKQTTLAETSTSPIALTQEQSTALDQIRSAARGFTPWLLHGVTGSGKTEIYLRLISDALARGEQALLLIPEINLTPQLEMLLRGRFPRAMLASLHSGLSESERLHAWQSAQNGAADIIIGTRLAVFTPLPRLGLIVVDEEHDASFKQGEGLRYSARDLALLRGQRCEVPVILGSATPSLETFYKALNLTYRMLALTHRINAMLPVIDCIDIRQESLIDGLSQPLLRATRSAMDRGDQSLVFINRRGYAPVLACASCGWTSGCSRCSANLVFHLRDKGQLRCHHCGHTEPPPIRCPQCGNQDLVPIGQGTQRTEQALARIFPDARILRIDRDTTARKNAWSDMRRKIQDREVDILVGTQILAKGHDFPQLNLVGVVNADSSLYSSDFRAAEHLFAQLMQVAGRAGRGKERGQVLIQTQFPGHPLYQALQRDDYRSYAQTLLAERERAGFPPFVHQAVLRAESPKLEHALEFLSRAASAAHKYRASVTIYDPVPAALARRAGLERAQLMVEAHKRTALHAFLNAWQAYLPSIASKVRWSLDVDPLEV